MQTFFLIVSSRIINRRAYTLYFYYVCELSDLFVEDKTAGPRPRPVR